MTVIELHDCESAVEWVKIKCTLALDPDCKEGEYSLKMITTDTNNFVEHTFTTAIDISALTHFRFWIKGDNCSLKLWVLDSAGNMDNWNITMPQTSWILNPEEIATPDESYGTIDYSDIKKMRFAIVETGKTIYFDYIIAYKPSTVIEDIIFHLENNWNDIATPRPSFIDGHKVIGEIKGLNYIQVFCTGVDYEDADCSGAYRDEDYSVLLLVGSRDIKAKRDLMMTEVNRICNIALTRYSYNRIEGKADLDMSDLWQTNVIFELKRFMVMK